MVSLILIILDELLQTQEEVINSQNTISNLNDKISQSSSSKTTEQETLTATISELNQYVIIFYKLSCSISVIKKQENHRVRRYEYRPK